MNKKKTKVRQEKSDKEKKPLRAAVVDSLQLPKDLVYGAAVLTVTGRNEAYVENYKGIMEYTDTKIRLQTKTCQLEIIGTELYIAYYTNDEMKITGQIQDIHYQK